MDDAGADDEVVQHFYSMLTASGIQQLQPSVLTHKFVLVVKPDGVRH